MNAIKYWLQYLTVVSLLLLMISGIYDMIAGVKAANWYLRWHGENYGSVSVSTTIFTYALGLLRGAAAFGCGPAGLTQVRKKRIRTGYLLFLAFWAGEYTLAVFSKAYKGIQPDDMLQMLIALFCFTTMALQYLIHFKNRGIWS